MEIYASAAMAKIGQALHQQRDAFAKSTVPKLSDKPSMNNMYSSEHWDTVRADERTRGMANWEAAKEPMRTGVVPEPAYASMFQPLSHGLGTSEPVSIPSRGPVSTMAGTSVSREDFTHNNMQPYFRGSVRQNVDPGANASILENRTGRSDMHKRKQAVECFFEPTAGFGHVCGAPDSTNYSRDRISPFQRRANDFPIETVRVGPGLGLGFTATPDGGFQQGATQDYVMPKSVDELRTASKPKITMELKNPQGPMKGVAQRGLIGDVDKNRPDTYFEQTADMLLKTTGAQLKEKMYSEQIVKATSRVDTHLEYQGGAQTSATKPGMGEDYDFGKDSVMVFKNERDITGTKTVISNITSMVKAVVAPLFDIFRHNHKEYTLDSARIYGNMQAQIPSKPTTYDPVTHMMRTTVREQLDDSARPYGNMHAQIPSKITTYDPVTHMMRTTIKETTDDAARPYGNMHAQVPSKGTTYDPVDHMMKTTIKEQTIHDTTISNARGHDAPPVEFDDVTKTTVRQTLGVQETTRNVSAHKYNVVVYDIDAVAKTTIRQTTKASGSMYGFVGGDVTERSGAYSVIDVEMPLTQKQFVSDYEYQGTSQSKSDFRPMSHEADDNAEIDGTREALHLAAGNTPAAGGAFTGVASDQIDMESKRLMGDSVSTRETGNKRGIQVGARRIDGCEITRQVAREFDNPQDGRLDSQLLNSLNTNPYSININPMV